MRPSRMQMTTCTFWAGPHKEIEVVVDPLVSWMAVGHPIAETVVEQAVFPAVTARVSK